MDNAPQFQDQSPPPSPPPVTPSPTPQTPPENPAPSPNVLAAPTPRRLRLRRLLRPAIGLVVLLVVASAVALYVQLNIKSAPPRVKVGVMMAFSGGSSSMGYGAMKGVQLAKKQLGADNIDIVQVDSKCDAKTAGEAVRSLIAQKVAAIIGEGCSSASVAALPAANNAKIPMISPSASSPALSIPDDYFFRVVPPDTFQGSFMAQTIYDRGLRNVGALDR